jgi:aspartate kinase
MKVFKFGGASVQNVDGIKNVSHIIEQHKNEKLLIVVSAMGKTTNALEAVANAFFEHKKDEALALFEQIKQQHLTVAKYLLLKEALKTEEQLKDFFTEVEWLLHDKPVRNYDYYYDQIVCIGELLSTVLVNAYLNEINLKTNWLDIRDYFRTDNNFRDATIAVEYTANRIKTLEKLFENTNIILTQGFIGSTSDNESTTLGREGSDYSAALIANFLKAESVSIWKDVKGVLNADPKQFEDTILLPKLSYEEVIEMAFYGAQVIHPKTIKPLQNGNIPLYVKCFTDVQIPGTEITNAVVKNLPPIIVLKNNQVLVQFKSLDFSFVTEQPIIALYSILNNLKIKPNLTQTGAITASLCLDNNEEKINQLAVEASQYFEVNVLKNVQLLTMRHYTKEALDKLTEGKEFIMQQKTGEIYQAVMYG